MTRVGFKGEQASSGVHLEGIAQLSTKIGLVRLAPPRDAPGWRISPPHRPHAQRRVTGRRSAPGGRRDGQPPDAA